jgi:F420-non-reducing hydrogenase iron-sulfur subunit
MTSEKFEPRILLFACNWCSYAGLDLAGTSRTQYPPNVTIIKTMCSGRLDPTYVMEAFRNGADGVLITGCHPGDCHYQEGNYKTMRRYSILKRILAQFGIEEDRLRLEWISAAEGARAGQVIGEMVDSLKKLGPLRIVEG